MIRFAVLKMLLYSFFYFYDTVSVNSLAIFHMAAWVSCWNVHLLSTKTWNQPSIQIVLTLILFPTSLLLWQVWFMLLYLTLINAVSLAVMMIVTLMIFSGNLKINCLNTAILKTINFSLSSSTNYCKLFQHYSLSTASKVTTSSKIVLLFFVYINSSSSF